MSDESAAAADPAPAPSPSPEGSPPVASPEPAKPANVSLLDTPESAVPPPSAPQKWPDDWREQMAGDDEKALNQLKRFKSPETLLKSYQEASKRISEGVKPLAIDKDSTPEEIAKYRAKMGIPEEASAYGLKFSNDELNANGGEFLGSFSEYALENNLPPGTAQSLVDWYEGVETLREQDRSEAAFNMRQDAQQELMAEWGGEYKSTTAAIKTFLDSQMGEEAKAELIGKRFEDGTFLGDNPHFLRMMADVALDTVGPNAIFSGDVETMAKDINTQIEEGMKLMTGTPEERRKYRSEEYQDYMRGLYEKKNKLAQRQRK